MKKLFISSAFLLGVLSASSQVEFGIFAGPQMTSVNYKIQGVKQKNESKYGFQAGAALKVPFENKLYFTPMAFYSMKGYKVTLNRFVYPPDVNATDNNTTFHNFELAALLQYDFSSKPAHLFIRIGPSLDFQLFGKEKFNLNGGGSVNRKLKFGPGEYGHYLANYLAHLGYETASGFMIFAQYTHGAANMNNADGGPAIRHRAYGISIGKYFNRKKIVMDTRNKE
ncbi:MAG TPA: porin family protein [Chitinophagaceae bacterium]|nr:porin family protein [Chitinophagaceae bacterium]